MSQRKQNKNPQSLENIHLYHTRPSSSDGGEGCRGSKPSTAHTVHSQLPSFFSWLPNLCISQFYLHPAPPQADPWALAFFLPWRANSRGWGLLSCQIPRAGNEKRGQMPSPPSTLQHLSLIVLSNSAILSILSILMCDFYFINVFLCNSLRILIKTSRRDDMHQFMVLVLI